MSLDIADIQKKSILSIMWHLGWFGMGQNTPTGCGNDLPIILRTSKNHKKSDYCPPYVYIYTLDNTEGPDWLPGSAVWYGAFLAGCQA